ncbi:MAG: hydrogenase expression/formation protein HypE, partial [Armatimonadota bacterium]
MNDLTLQCPLPQTDYQQVLLAHGGGGRLMQQLLGDVFFHAFDNELLRQRHDASVFAVGGQRLAFTTDGYVVDPIFFPGGSIGDLAVHGTVNDLAMAGARPLYLSAGFIIEEGFPVADLQRVVGDMAGAAAAAGVRIITGDTKVVNRGKADGVFITTAGVGVFEHDLSISPSSVQPGDAIILSGDIARHGIAIMSVREGLEFGAPLITDCAPLNGLVAAMLAHAPAIHALLEQVGWLPRNVQLLGVAVGPGSFTGLRVGVTTAKVFAYAVGADLLCISALEAIAAAAPDDVAELSAVI